MFCAPFFLGVILLFDSIIADLCILCKKLLPPRLPNLLLPQEPETHLGKYAELRRQYIKKHRRVLYTNLKTSGQLAAHLAEIETAAEKMVTRLVAQMAQNEGVTEELKAANPQRWTGLMNNLKHSAEETVLNDLLILQLF